MSKQFSILIVDDGKNNRQYMADLLLRCLQDPIIQQAENGQDAMDLVNQHIQHHRTSYDLIIMDYQMPVLNGAAATLGIRQLEDKAGITQPSIIITWSAALTAPVAKADDYLPKFTNKPSLLAMLRCYNLISSGDKP